jgi:hypothetical protein
LLKDAWICAIPSTTTRLAFLRSAIFVSLPCPIYGSDDAGPYGCAHWFLFSVHALASADDDVFLDNNPDPSIA